MKKILSILLLVALVSSIAICAVGCTPEETLYEGALTKEQAEELLFGQNKAFALMDKSVNFAVEYKATEGVAHGEQVAGEAKLILDETDGANFVSVYANSSLVEGNSRQNSIAYMFLTWEENKRGDLEKTLVYATSYSETADAGEPSWQEYSSSAIDSTVKQTQLALIANSGAHTGTRLIRENIYNQNDDVYDTIQVTGKAFYSDEALTQHVKTEIVITYNYLNDEDVRIYGTATVVLENKEVKLVDGTTATSLAITSITILEEGGPNFVATYTYGVNELGAPTKDNYQTAWPEAYRIAQ